MIVLLKTIQVIAALTLLVLVHELGHFAFAKMFHTRVDKFYLFFNPKFSIVKCKKVGGKLRFKFFAANEDDYDPEGNPLDPESLGIDDWRRYPENTEYGIGWVPLGGYCKIAGMIDESMDKKAMALPPKPWEFRTKPAWQRFLIMFGGVLNNFILAIVLYSVILGHWGEEYLKTEDAVYGIATNDLSYEIGFRDGDRILSLDGEPVENFSMIQANLVRSKATEALVLRDGDTVSIRIDPVYIPAMLNTPGMFGLAFPFVIGEVPEESINVDSDIQAGDEMVAINGKEMFLVNVIQKELLNYKDSIITASLKRDGEMLESRLAVDTAGHIGVMLDTDFTKFFTVTTNKYGFPEAVPAGAAKAWQTIRSYVQELGLIFSPKTEAYKSVGSFIAIGRIFPDTWDWYRFWSLCAMLSIMLGVLNLVPIPGLDGGHILFLIVEMVTGRKPGDKFLEVAEMIGLILICALMVLAFGNDIKSLFIH